MHQTHNIVTTNTLQNTKYQFYTTYLHAYPHHYYAEFIRTYNALRKRFENESKTVVVSKHQQLRMRIEKISASTQYPKRIQHTFCTNANQIKRIRFA